MKRQKVDKKRQLIMHNFPKIYIKDREDTTIKNAKVTSAEEMVVRFVVTFVVSRTFWHGSFILLLIQQNYSSPVIQSFYYAMNFHYIVLNCVSSCISPVINTLNNNCSKLSKTLKQFVDKLLTNCLSAFEHFIGLVLKGLKIC